MGLRELLILVLIMAIIGVILRGLYIALSSRRGRIRMALDKNVPEYDLEEIEMRELPSGGARLVERSFAAAMKQSTEQNAREAGRSTSTQKAEAAIPVLTEKVAEPAENSMDDADDQAFPSVDFSSYEVSEEPFVEPLDEPLDEPAPESGNKEPDEHPSVPRENEQQPEPEPEPEPERYGDEGALDAQVFVDDYSAGDDDDDEDFDDDDFDEDDFDDQDGEDDELDDMLTRSSWLDEPVEAETTEEVMKKNPDQQERPDAVDVPEEQEARANFADDDDVESFGAATDDDFDVLLDGYDDERSQRLEELEAQQETASRKFAAWAGRKMDSLSTGAGSLLRATRDQRAHSVDEPVVGKGSGPKHVQQNELDLDFPEPPGVVPEDELTTDAGHEVGAEPDARAEQDDTQAVNNNVDQQYSEVLVVNIMAREGELIHGDDLLPVLLSAGLRFGEMSIFHLHTGGKTGPVLFSVANVLNPGTFDLNAISDFSTRGLCFFLTLPNAISNMQAFDEMLRTAQQICDGLDAELKDDNRSVMTAQTVEHYRERIRSFELRQLRGGR